MNKAAFFDRDGTLIEDEKYLSAFDQIKVLPKSIKLCLELQKQGYLLFVVTNQSGVARGYFSESFVCKTHQLLKDIFDGSGVHFKKFYYCPHHSTAAVKNKYDKKCDCRKPNPGMILRAAKEFNIDLSRSLMFGDKKSDLQAGKNAGCKAFYIQDFWNKASGLY